MEEQEEKKPEALGATGEIREKRNEKKRGRSLKTTLTILFFALVAGTIVLVWLANRFFIEQYYILNKERALEEAFVSLNEASATSSFGSDDFDAWLVRIASRDNLGVIIMDQESKTVKCCSMDTAAMQRRMWDNLFGTTEDYDGGNGIRNGIRYYLVEKVPLRASGYDAAVRERLLAQNVQVVLDARTQTRYLEMWGSLNSGSFYLMRSAIESIHANSIIANRLIMNIGILMIAAGLVVALILGNRITKPIRQLTEISKRMRALDFSARYAGDDGGEIGELGENINELSSTLEHTIRDLKTANQKLQTDLERKNKDQAMQQEFIANVTHELKTPIALIQGYAEGLQDNVAEDEESRNFYVNVILDEAGKMDRMVRQLLTLTQLEFGENSAEFERFDVTELIRNILQATQLMTQEKGITVRFDAPDHVYVWADPFMTEEIFRNYFSNAVHHCDGEKVIDVSVQVSENRGRISVFNTGTPIPEEAIGRIWDKFYKVDKARTREYGGSGVGLSVVKAMMELMHGPYGVQNYDNGVAFWFELETQ